MPVSAQDNPGDLIAHDEQFRKLALEHSRYEEQLQQLNRQPYLSAEDILLETQLKKIKLRLKDQMQQMIALRRRGSTAR
jgi:uncharacterized protein YdcH (DUF465 family)